MKRYVLSVMTTVEVEAFSLSDAEDVVKDVFGEGAFGDLEVTDFEICDQEELG
jgi:hypothetical protein